MYGRQDHYVADVYPKFVIFLHILIYYFYCMYHPHSHKLRFNILAENTNDIKDEYYRLSTKIQNYNRLKPMKSTFKNIPTIEVKWNYHSE